MAKVLVAPTKFTGSLDAQQVADSVIRGMRAVHPDVDATAMPVADGGEGTLSAALAAGFTRVPVVACGPTGYPVRTAYARREGLAVLEMADVSGLARLPGGRPAPLTASSRGTGEVLAAALDAGCTSVVLGIGGSACTDGGAGLAQALGARPLDASGRRLPDGGAALARISTLDLSDLHPRLADAEVVIACDVANPLTGPSGAAAVQGPQRGAGVADVVVLEHALQRWAEALAATTGSDLSGTPGAGAAGGVGLVGLALLGGRLRAGANLVLQLVGFHRQATDAQLVVTGEGMLDARTLRGKVPVEVARAAAAAGVPAVAVCGTSTLSAEELSGAGFAATYALDQCEGRPPRCSTDAATLLEQLGSRIAVEQLAALSTR